MPTPEGPCPPDPGQPGSPDSDVGLLSSAGPPWPARGHPLCSGGVAVWGDLEVHPTAVPSLQVGVLLGPLPSSAWKPLCALKKFCSCLYQKKKNVDIFTLLFYLFVFLK